ncbi:MAG: hypothetical protein CMH60_03545 [Myxococcales bacterium]|nr:hypothetical protein [Myxococcales bacterium]|tara:strand:+ start:867 stop:1778 length:912 start_codon:yes stop_codon:yes gene_type:complete
MKSLLSWFLVLGILVSGAGLALKMYKDLNTEHSYQLKVIDLQNQFQTQLAGLGQLDEDTYRREIGISLTRYFSQLNQLGKEFPGLLDVERELRTGEEMLSKGHMSESQKLAREERINWTLALYQKMRVGQYRPLYTVADKTFRFDLYDIQPVDTDTRNPRIRLSYAHWNAFGPISYKMIEGNIRIKQDPDKPAEVPQIVGEGQPPTLQIKPGRWVSEFIPGVEVGYYELPLLPPNAEKIQLNFDFGLRTIGGTEIVSNIVFPDMPVASSWKVGEGKEWQGKERFASDEEIVKAGGAPTQKITF